MSQNKTPAWEDVDEEELRAALYELLNGLHTRTKKEKIVTETQEETPKQTDVHGFIGTKDDHTLTVSCSDGTGNSFSLLLSRSALIEDMADFIRSRSWSIAESICDDLEIGDDDEK